MFLVGLHGKKRSGKDTTGRYLQEWGAIHGYPVVREAFADRMKLALYRMFYPDCTLEQALKWAEQDKGTREMAFDGPGVRARLSHRQALQRFGETHRDLFGINFWVDQVLPQTWVDLYDWFPGISIVVLTDVRLDHEAERITKLGGQVWEIARPESDDDPDITEQGIDPKYISSTIHNTDSLDELRDLVTAQIGRRFYTWQ